MKKLALLFLGALLCNSCFFMHKGTWGNGMCRPKRPNFKLLKTPFKETDKLVYLIRLIWESQLLLLLLSFTQMED